MMSQTANRFLSVASSRCHVSRRQRILPFHRSFSTSSESTPSGSDPGDGQTHSQQPDRNEDAKPSSLLFPWRHETVPLPRLVEGTPENTTLGPMLTSNHELVPGNARLNSAASAYMFLDVPWYEIIWLSHFEADLADSVSWAFTQGVGELLWLLPLQSSSSSDDDSEMDQISPDDDNNNDSSVDFHRTINLVKAAAASMDVVGKSTDERISTNSSKENLQASLKSMFQDKVLEYYQSAKDNALASLLAGSGSDNESVSANSSIDDTNDDKDSNNGDTTIDDPTTEAALEIRLQMEPYQSELISLYSIPYMSRKLAHDDPNYQIFYRNMISKPARDRAPDLSLLRSEYLDGQGRMESTIIAQVLVWCHEIFYVKHLPSGKVLQGQEIMYSKDSVRMTPEVEASGDNSSSSSNRNDNQTRVRQQIPHLIRMEKTVITLRDPITGAYSNQQGDWTITDIDDLLEGNFVV